MKKTPKLPETNTPERNVLRVPIMLVVVATILFTGAVWIVAAIGEPHVDALSEYVGEANLSLARAHREVEDFDGAITWYEKSLDKPFDYDVTRAEAHLEYIVLLRELGKDDEALRVARSGFELTNGEGRIYNEYFALLRQTDQLDAAWNLAKHRNEQAIQSGNDSAIKWSYYHMATISRDQDNIAEAYTLFQKSYDTIPCGDSAYQCATTAKALGDSAALKTYAQSAIELGNENVRQRAQTLLEGI